MGSAVAELENAREALRRVFGFEHFRGVQADVVGRVLGGRSTLAVMPTGAGKSLTYQLPATMLAGTCVVISPLIALMHDQLRSARANGIRAATLTSADADATSEAAEDAATDAADTAVEAADAAEEAAADAAAAAEAATQAAEEGM